MPSRSAKQARTMAAIAHGWKPPKSSGIDIPVKVAKEFNKEDAKQGSRSVAKAVANQMSSKKL